MKYKDVLGLYKASGIMSDHPVLTGGLAGASIGALLPLLFRKHRKLKKILLGAAIGGGLGAGSAYGYAKLMRREPTPTAGKEMSADPDDAQQLAESIWHRLMYDSVQHGGNNEGRFPSEFPESLMPKFYNGVFRGKPAKGWVATYEVLPDKSDYKVTISPAPGFKGIPVTITKSSYR